MIQSWKSSQHIRLNGKLSLIFECINFILVTNTPRNALIILICILVGILFLTLKLSGFELASKVRIIFKKLKILCFGLLFWQHFILLSQCFDKFIFFLFFLLILFLLQLWTPEKVISTWDSKFYVWVKLKFFICSWRELLFIDKCSLSASQIIQWGKRILFMKLKDGVLTTDSGVIDKNITKIFESPNQMKLFFLETDLTDHTSIFNNLKAL